MEDDKYCILLRMVTTYFTYFESDSRYFIKYIPEKTERNERNTLTVINYVFFKRIFARELSKHSEK